jgi:uncharacterized surface protein with fasciclin (FAS1) repeats
MKGKMNQTNISFASAGAALLLLVACGGNPSSPTTVPTVVQIPTAVPTTTAPSIVETDVMTATEVMTGTTIPGATDAMTGTTMPTTTDTMTSTDMMTGTNAMSDTSMMDMNIAEAAMGNNKLKTLVMALQAAGLAETLKGSGPFTVFAPTDEAFAKLDASTLTTLLKPENKEQLAMILKYHVVSGEVSAADVMKMTSAKTLEGEDLTIKVDGSTVMVNNAKVIMTDIKTKNGVIHVIDTVLMPTQK